VCGKGAEAAALTALARHTIRTAALLDPRPTSVLEVLNTVLLEQETSDRFCTAAFAVITPTDDGARLTVALGGHPQPQLVRGDELRRIGEPGTLLGALPHPHTTDHTVDLRSGDTVVFYTDGLTDIPCEGGVLGEQWVIGTLRERPGDGATVLADWLGDRAVAEQRGVARDDIAVLAISVP